MPGKARRARVNRFLGVAGLGWVSTKRSGGPGSISGCKALQGVAEGCVGGIWYLGGSNNNSTNVLGALWCVGGCLAVEAVFLCLVIEVLLPGQLDFAVSAEAVAGSWLLIER